MAAAVKVKSHEIEKVLVDIIICHDSFPSDVFEVFELFLTSEIYINYEILIRNVNIRQNP